MRARCVWERILLRRWLDVVLRCVVLARFDVLKCHVAENSCCDPPRPDRSSMLQGDVHRVVLACAQCMGLLRTGLLRRRCAVVVLLALTSGGDDVQFRCGTWLVGSEPCVGMSIFARLICRVLSGRMPGARVSCIAPAPPCAAVCPRRSLLALRVCQAGSQRFRCPIVILLPG